MKTMMALLLAFSLVLSASGCMPSAPDAETAELSKKAKEKAKAKTEGKEVVDDETDETPAPKDEPKAKAKAAPKAKDPAPKAKDPAPKAKDDVPELKGTWTVEGKMPPRPVGKKVARDDITGSVNFSGKTFSVSWNDGQDRTLSGKIEFVKTGDDEVEIAFTPTGGTSLSAFENKTSATLTWQDAKLTGSWYKQDGTLGGDYSLTPPKAKAPAEPKKK